jgi:hypothetical protein
LQVAGGRDEHFGYIRDVASLREREGMGDYFEAALQAHAAAGLAFESHGCRGYVNLCPTRDREITLLSSGLVAGADAVFALIRAFIDTGTSCFSLIAFVSPLFDPDGQTDLRTMRVVWRICDRGDVFAPHSDTGAMELFAGSWVVAVSPWSWYEQLLGRGVIVPRLAS